jgi:uncharacterized protein YutE (UPF0331/DUF86 family)
MYREVESIEAYSSQLSKILPLRLKEYEGLDMKSKYAAERLVQLISDAEMEIVVLIYRATEPRPSGDVETMLEALSGKFTKEIVQNIKDLRKLRNALVHAYSTSNYDKEVFSMATKLKNIGKFIESAKRAMG